MVELPHREWLERFASQTLRLDPALSVLGALRQAISAFYAEGPSGGHYQNLEGPYTQVGCGVFIDNRLITFVQDFR